MLPPRQEVWSDLQSFGLQLRTCLVQWYVLFPRTYRLRCFLEEVRILVDPCIRILMNVWNYLMGGLHESRLKNYLRISCGKKENCSCLVIIFTFIDMKNDFLFCFGIDQIYIIPYVYCCVAFASISKCYQPSVLVCWCTCSHNRRVLDKYAQVVKVKVTIPKVRIVFEE